MELTSPSNPKLKHVVKLRSCATREEFGEMIVEGYRECRRALDRGYRPKAIFHCPDFYLKNENEPELVRECASLGAEVYTCSKICFEKIAYKERPDGLLMVGPHVSIKLSNLKLPQNALVIVTEAIEKPGNLGTILRSADAANAAAVIVCDRTTDVHNPNVVRASPARQMPSPRAVCPNIVVLPGMLNLSNKCIVPDTANVIIRDPVFSNAHRKEPGIAFFVVGSLSSNVVTT